MGLSGFQQKEYFKAKVGCCSAVQFPSEELAAVLTRLSTYFTPTSIPLHLIWPSLPGINKKVYHTCMQHMMGWSSGGTRGGTKGGIKSGMRGGTRDGP